MRNLKIIGAIWMVSAIVPAVKRASELWALATQHSGVWANAQGVGFWISQILVEISFLLIVVTGWGLFRLRRWATVAGGVVGVLFVVICVWFIVTQGTRQGPEPYVAIWCLLVLSFYTLFSVWRSGRSSQIAEPGAPPNGGSATQLCDLGVTEGPPSVN